MRALIFNAPMFFYADNNTSLFWQKKKLLSEEITAGVVEITMLANKAAKVRESGWSSKATIKITSILMAE